METTEAGSLTPVTDSRSPPEAAEKLTNLELECRALAERLANLETQVARGGKQLPGSGFSDRKLASSAAAIYRARRRRTSLFDEALFGEPAWDMLLDLFIKRIEGERISTTSLCMAGDVPVATGLRWIEKLEEHGLVLREQARDDGRVNLVELTPEGYRLMRSYVSEGLQRAEVPT